MALLRPTVILLACLALLASSGVAEAASRLTATPPVPLPSSSVTAPATGTASSSASTALPRTGNDLPLELVLAAALVLTGGLLRVRASRIE